MSDYYLVFLIIDVIYNANWICLLVENIYKELTNSKQQSVLFIELSFSVNSTFKLYIYIYIIALTVTIDSNTILQY